MGGWSHSVLSPVTQFQVSNLGVQISRSTLTHTDKVVTKLEDYSLFLGILCDTLGLFGFVWVTSPVTEFRVSNFGDQISQRRRIQINTMDTKCGIRRDSLGCFEVFGPVSVLSPVTRFRVSNFGAQFLGITWTQIHTKL